MKEKKKDRDGLAPEQAGMTAEQNADSAARKVKDQGSAMSGNAENAADSAEAMHADGSKANGENAAEEKESGDRTEGAGIDTVHEMIRELGAMMEAARTPAEPTEEEKKAAALEAQKARKKKIRQRRRRAVRSMLLRLLVLVVVVYVLFFHLIGVTLMPNGDMYPRIDSGDLVVFYRLDKDVRAQDIIVFEKDLSELLALTAEADGEEEQAVNHFVPDSVHETSAEEEKEEGFLGTVKGWLNDAAKWLKIKRDDSKQTFICRVVAAAGDTVEITDDGRLLVNGNAMIESNIFSQTTSYVSFTEYPLTLHAGECFVMADLRNGGADSRFFGPVETDEILGTVITIMRRNNL